MTEPNHEARWILSLVDRGVTTIQEARDLIRITPAQQEFLRRELGPSADLIIESRTQTLAQFDELVGRRRERRNRDDRISLGPLLLSPSETLGAAQAALAVNGTKEKSWT